MKTKPKSTQRQCRRTPREKIAANVRACQPKPIPRAGGRPTGYQTGYCQEITKFFGRGYSLTSFAGSIGVSRDSNYAWAEAHPEFSDALAIARAARTFYWEKRLDIAGPDARAVIYQDAIANGGQPVSETFKKTKPTAINRPPPGSQSGAGQET